MDEKVVFNKEAIELLLSTAQNEYDNEHNRTTIIDTKTNISLPLTTAYFFIASQMCEYDKILLMSTNSFNSMLSACTLFILYTTSLIFSLLSVIWMVRVIMTKEYRVINPADFYDIVFLKEDSLVLMIGLLRSYIDGTAYNKNTNDKRIPIYKKGWLFAAVSVFGFVFYSILSNVIL